MMYDKVTLILSFSLSQVRPASPSFLGNIHMQKEKEYAIISLVKN